MDYNVANNELIIFVGKTLFSEDILFKCFYWYGNNYSISINSLNKHTYKVNIKLKSDTLIDFDGEKLYEKVIRDLNDFKLRDIVTKETKNIRELLVAKAFAHYDFQEHPSSNVSDPIGFDPQTL